MDASRLTSTLLLCTIAPLIVTPAAHRTKVHYLRSYLVTLLSCIFTVYYKAASDRILCAGDIESNPGPSPLSYIHWNVNSLRADRFARIPLLQAHAAIHNHDIIAITESGITNRVPDSRIDIPGYTPIRCDLVDDSHGGVVVYHKNDLAAVNRHDLAFPTNTVVLQLTIDRKKIFFIASYRKCGQTPEQYTTYKLALEQTLEKTSTENPHERILTGDFNAHNSEWHAEGTTDVYGTDMQDMLERHLLHQLVDQPTYITRNGESKTLVDLVCVGQPNLVVHNEVLGSIYHKSHHQINYVKLNFQVFRPPPYKRLVFHYDRANAGMLQRACRMYDWVGELTYLADNPEGQVELFDEVISNISKNFIPHEEKTFYAGDPPWLTKNCKTFYKKYNQLYKRYARRGYPPAEKARVEATKKEYDTIVTAAKDAHIKRLSAEVSNPRTGQKKYWSALKKLLNKTISTVIPPIMNNNTIVTDAHEKSILFNDYFKNQCTLMDTNSVLPVFERKTHHTISDINISPHQISVLIKKLNVSKSHGHDGLSARMLQMYGDALSIPLSIIFKNCIAKGYFPEKWKKANVTAVHKKMQKMLCQTTGLFHFSLSAAKC